MTDRSGPDRAAPEEASDPLSPAVRRWVTSLVKALKGVRVYSDNNEMLLRYRDEVQAGLDALFERAEEFSITVREDRLLHRGDVVWVDPDRLDGLPFTLFRNAFRRLTFERGMNRDEVLAFLRAVAADYSRFDVVGEDLVTALWRLQLPHLRYITIDTLTVASRQAVSDEEKEEIEQLQSDVEAIVALVYRTDAGADDIVSGLSISEEDLEALKEVRAESPEELELLDRATERGLIDVPSAEVDAFSRALGDDGREALVARTMDVLVRVLFTERSGRDAQTSVELLQQLMDTLLIGQRFSHATELVRRLRDAARDVQDLQKLHIARQLLRLFSAENRLLPIVVGLNDKVAARSVSEIVAFLRALGEPAVPALMTSLSQVEAPLHRRIVRDLIIELGAPDAEILEAAMEDSPGYVVRDLLVIAARRPPGEITGLVLRALRHEHPRVRDQAVKMLRAYSEGRADELLRQSFEDPDLEVRQTALRVAVHRKSRPAAARLRALLSTDAVGGRSLGELRQMCLALVKIDGEDAVPALVRWLNPGLLASLKNTDLQVAAAMALRDVPSESARAALTRGTRSLVPKVRDACRRALEYLDRDDSGPVALDGPRELLEVDPTFDLLDHESGDFVPVARPESFDSPRPPAHGHRASGPVAASGLPPAPPPEASTQVIGGEELAAARRAIRADGAAPARPDLTEDLQLTEDLTEDHPPGSVREVIPEIDVIVPRADRTPTPTSSGTGGSRS